jgi:hypothetical protein
MTVTEMASLGGKARRDKLTPERRKEIAAAAAAARIRKRAEATARPAKGSSKKQTKA